VRGAAAAMMIFFLSMIFVPPVVIHSNVYAVHWDNIPLS